MLEGLKNNSIFVITKTNLVMFDYDNNGQSAAKSLLNEKGSTTISRKESTLFNKVEKAHIKCYSITDKVLNESGIYGIYCKTNNKIYVGSAISFSARLTRHLYHLKHNTHHSIKLQRAFNKHGINDFEFLILEFTDTFNLLEKEFYWINYLDSYTNGFNCTDVCKKPKSFKLKSEQIQKRIEKSSKKVICLDLEGNFLRKYSSLSEAAKAINDQTTNISSCCKGKLNYVKDFIFVYESEYNTNKDYKYNPKPKVFSESHRKNISNAVSGKPKSKNQIDLLRKRSSKSVVKLDLEGNVVKIYSSMKECCYDNQLYIKTLKNSISSKTSLGGFIYTFNEDIV